MPRHESPLLLFLKQEGELPLRYHAQDDTGCIEHHLEGQTLDLLIPKQRAYAHLPWPERARYEHIDQGNSDERTEYPKGKTSHEKGKG